MPMVYPATEVFHQKTGARRVVFSLEEYERAVYKEGYGDEAPELPAGKSEKK